MTEIGMSVEDGPTISKWPYVVAGLAGFCAFAYCLIDMSRHKRFPSTENVQQGYVAPSQLEIRCEDLDKNGEPETIMKIGDKQYLLRYNKEGKPVISEYEVRPTEIIVKGE